MEEKKKRKVKLYSYLKVWKVEKKIYAIQNIVLPVPVNPYDMLYFGIAAIVIYLFGKICPPFVAIPVVIRLGIIPYGITKYMIKVKLDGKSPIKYFVGLFIHLLTERGKSLEKYQSQTDVEKKVRLNWKCSEGWQ